MLTKKKKYNRSGFFTKRHLILCYFMGLQLAGLQLVSRICTSEEKELPTTCL